MSIDWILKSILKYPNLSMAWNQSLKILASKILVPRDLLQPLSNSQDWTPVLNLSTLKKPQLSSWEWEVICAVTLHKGARNSLSEGPTHRLVSNISKEVKVGPRIITICPLASRPWRRANTLSLPPEWPDRVESALINLNSEAKPSIQLSILKVTKISRSKSWTIWSKWKKICKKDSPCITEVKT